MHRESQSRFQELLAGFSHAMLVTRAEDGGLRARPMAIAEIDEDCNLWFVTGHDSGKLPEIGADPRVCVTFQEGARSLSLTGRATLVDDRARLRQLWNEGWRIWFPGGPDDPEAILLHVASTRGEYWDHSGLAALTFLVRAGRAYLAGETMQDDPQCHQKVDL